MDGWLPKDERPSIDAYGGAPPGAGPLSQIKARNDVVPFYPRDELEVLLNWSEGSKPAVADPTIELGVVHGVGGAGKTHLAAELCKRLAAQGWYTGFVAKHPPPEPADLAWLRTVVAPILMVVDYVEDSRVDDVVAILRKLRGREQPARVLMTARGVGQWQTDITQAVERDKIDASTSLLLPLPRRHPLSTGVFRRAARRFAQLPNMGPNGIVQPPDDPRWTTLDLILEALGRQPLHRREASCRPHAEASTTKSCIGSSTTTAQPVKPDDSRSIPDELLRKVGAAVTLRAPVNDRLTNSVTAVEEFATASTERAVFVNILGESYVAPDAADDGIAIRPDPVGEHLVVSEMREPGLLVRSAPLNPFEERLFDSNDTAEIDARMSEGLRACVVTTRAAEQYPEGAADLACRLLDVQPQLWRPGFTVALQQGGPFAHVLTEMAERTDTGLPLAVMAAAVPLGHAALRPFALIATEHSRPPDDDIAETATWWNYLAARRGDVGDQVGALAAIDEAVGFCRRLAAADPTAFRPGLAMVLNNQAIRRGAVGDRTGALTAIDEAVVLYRQLVDADSPAFLPKLVAALTNQAIYRGAVGDRTGALTVIDEAVEVSRQLVAADTGFRAELAIALLNQAQMARRRRGPGRCAHCDRRSGRPLPGSWSTAVPLPSLLTSHCRCGTKLPSATPSVTVPVH